MIKAVIFDMDGVISDTLPLHGESESKVFLKYGIKMPPEEIINKFNAVPDKKMFEEIFNKFNIKFNLKKVKDEKWNIFKKLAKKGIQVVPGSLKFIDNLLEEGFVLGLASSSPSKVIDLVINSLGIKDKFRVIVGTEEVIHGKPSPDIYLLAAKRLKIDPAYCLVIEDAIRGIQAAKAAGMKCIGITTTHKREELRGADRIFDNFKELSLKEIRGL